MGRFKVVGITGFETMENDMDRELCRLLIDKDGVGTK